MAGTDPRKPIGAVEACLRVKELKFPYLEEISVIAPIGCSKHSVSMTAAAVSGLVRIGLLVISSG